MARLSRRGFLLAGVGAAGLGGALLALRGLSRRSLGTGAARGLYGPLVPDPRKVLDLPEGFSYRVLQQRGELMSDGYRVPWEPDAMACFPGRDASEIVLMRNQECATDRRTGPYATGQLPPSEAYDPRSMGGVTRLVLDARSFELRSSNLVLAGTLRNCAGGPSPWGWITCEETTVDGHGFAFLCAPDAERVQPPRRLDGYGRYRHEAAAIDPATFVAYLTEDQSDGCLYRFVPEARGRPFHGRLQALAVDGRPGFDTGTGLAPGDVLDARWIDLDEPAPARDVLRARARAAGAARVVRGEGAWWAAGSCWIAASAGGPAAVGQIFRYTPLGPDRGALELFAQADGSDRLDMPDNLTMAPWGHLYACEDGSGENHLRVFTPDGQVWDFARNAHSDSELAGVCFAPDARALFVNLQHDGLTLVVTGPFESGLV